MNANDALFKVPIAPNKRVKISEMSDSEFRRKMQKDEADVADEDEERMYGSGLSQKDSQIADIVDQAECFQFELNQAKTTFAKFEKVLKKNLEMRLEIY